MYHPDKREETMAMIRPLKIRNQYNSRDLRAYNKYNQKLLQHLKEHHLEVKIFKLEQEALYPLLTDLQSQAEQLNRIYMEGHAFADKRCRKLRTGAQSIRQ